jgi:hypothetical protein
MSNCYPNEDSAARPAESLICKLQVQLPVVQEGRANDSCKECNERQGERTIKNVLIWSIAAKSYSEGQVEDFETYSVIKWTLLDVLQHEPIFSQSPPPQPFYMLLICSYISDTKKCCKSNHSTHKNT